jgi:tripartite-type tricarboxylate transporter receptor subunit TctC
MKRRDFLKAIAASVTCIPTVALGETYPSRPVRLVVGYAAGGANDIIARLIGQRLTEHLGQPFIIENRPGAASNIATEAVIRSAPDGYTLLLTGASNAINATLYEKLNFNFVNDTTPVAGVCRISNAMLTHPSLPATTVAEFIAYAKASANKLSMGSPGVGSPQHVAGEMFKMMTGIDMTHVPYRGGAPALTDLMGRQIPVCFASTASSVAYVRAGKLRALAVTGTQRSEAMPEVPPMADTVPGYEATAFYGVSAPKMTPPAIADRLNREINAALSDATLRVRLSEVGGTPLGGSPAEFGKLIGEEAAKWAKVVKFSGARVG